MSDPTRLEEIRAREIVAAIEGLPQDYNASWQERAVPLVASILRSEFASQEAAHAQLLETNKRLNRRAQSAEAALNERAEDWNKRSTDKQRNHYYTRNQELTAELASQEAAVRDAERANADWLRDITEEIAHREQVQAELSTLRSQLQGLSATLRKGEPVSGQEQTSGFRRGTRYAADQLDQILTSLNDLKGVEGDGP